MDERVERGAAQGGPRVVAVGAAQRPCYDGLDRVTVEGAIDRAGVAAIVQTRDYGFAYGGRTVTDRQLDATGHVTSTTVDVLDGGGKSTVTLREDRDGDLYSDRKTHDLRGNLIRTYHPFPVTGLQPWGYDPREEHYHNGLSELRLTRRDVMAGLPPIRVTNPTVGGVRTRDEEGFTRTVWRDVHGHISRVRQSAITTALYENDVLGRVRAYTDGDGNTFSFDLDLAGRLRQVSGPDIGTRLYEYDGPLRTHMTDSAGLAAQWFYDAHGRVTDLVTDDPETGAPLAYSWTYDGDWIGQVSASADPEGSVAIAYDDLGRAVRHARTWQSGLPDTVFERAYDLQDRVRHTTFPSGATLAETYRFGWKTTSEVSGSGAAGPVVTVDHEYDLYGRSRGWASTAVPQLAIDYTPAGEVDLIQLHGQGGDAWLRSYTWLDNGMVESSLREDPGLWIPTTHTYGYDAQRRLTSVHRSGFFKTPGLETFAYDGAGNLTARLDPDGTSWTYALVPGAGGRIDTRTSSAGTSEAYTYDDAGRVTSIAPTAGGPGRTFVYDALGRLRRATDADGNSVVFHRDADGNVVRREHQLSDGDFDELTFGAWHLDERTGLTTERFGTLGFWEDGDRRWVLREPGTHIGVALDDAGAPLGQREFRAYGGLWSSSGALPEHESHHGLPFVATTGILDTGVRAYAAEDGQWLQPEPLLLEGLHRLDLTDPAHFATYRYAGNDPINRLDPTGYDGDQNDGGGGTDGGTDPDLGQGETVVIVTVEGWEQQGGGTCGSIAVVGTYLGVTTTIHFKSMDEARAAFEGQRTDQGKVAFGREDIIDRLNRLSGRNGEHFIVSSAFFAETLSETAMIDPGAQMDPRASMDYDAYFADAARQGVSLDGAMQFLLQQSGAQSIIVSGHTSGGHHWASWHTTANGVVASNAEGFTPGNVIQGGGLIYVYKF